MTDGEYERLWLALVARGKILYDLKHTNVHNKKKQNNKIRPSNSTASTPEQIRRWILERSNGATVREAKSATGITWHDVNRLYIVCQECRYAIYAMLESRRLLEIENAYCDLEAALCGASSKRKTDFTIEVISRHEKNHL